MQTLHGTRVLIVEDEPLIMMELQDIVSAMGCEIVGSAARLAAAVELARESEFDVAMLDMNLNGDRIDPVAEIVRGRRRPIVFITGYAGAFAGRPEHSQIVEKPCSAHDIERALRLALRPPP